MHHYDIFIVTMHINIVIEAVQLERVIKQLILKFFEKNVVGMTEHSTLVYIIFHPACWLKPCYTYKLIKYILHSFLVDLLFYCIVTGKSTLYWFLCVFKVSVNVNVS